MNIATVISYCTLDNRFIDHCICQAKCFSNEVVVSLADKLYDVTPENVDIISDTIKRNEHYAKFVKYDPAKCVAAGYKHACASRWVGYIALSKAYDWVLFLDADEIIDGQRFHDDYRYLMSIQNYDSKGVIEFKANWYFRSARNQATTTEYAGTMVRPYFITQDRVFYVNERNGFRNVWPRNIASNITNSDQLPFIHHYSWVRTKDEMMHKVRGWGHKGERNWEQMVEDEFSHEFNGKDFVHGYSYRYVEPFVEVGL